MWLIMTSYYVIVSIRLYKEIGNDEPPWVPLSQEAKNPVSVGLKNIGNEQSTPR